MLEQVTPSGAAADAVPRGEAPGLEVDSAMEVSLDAFRRRVLPRFLIAELVFLVLGATGPAIGALARGELTMGVRVAGVYAVCLVPLAAAFHLQRRGRLASAARVAIALLCLTVVSIGLVGVAVATHAVAAVSLTAALILATMLDARAIAAWGWVLAATWLVMMGCRADADIAGFGLGIYLVTTLVPAHVLVFCGYGMRAVIRYRDEVIRRARRLQRATEAVNQELRATNDALQTANHSVRMARAEVGAAEDASRAKSTFLAHMSHELRTPLNIIIGYSEMILEVAGHTSNAQLATDVARIEGSAQHLLRLIDNILDLSKIEAGGVAVSLEDVDVEDVVEAVVAAARPLAQRGSNTLEYTVERAARTVAADAVRLRQILLNLLGNAAKFTANGAIRIRCSRAGSGPVVFEVADTGVGMTEEQLARIFTPFAQADETTTRRHGGTGLGLAISRSLAEAMGGRLTARSRPDVGSTFTLELPAASDGRARRTATAG